MAKKEAKKIEDNESQVERYQNEEYTALGENVLSQKDQQEK